MNNKFFVFLVFCSTAWMVSCSNSTTSHEPTAVEVPQDYVVFSNSERVAKQPDKIEEEANRKINAYRRAKGLGELQRRTYLDELARAHSQDMLKANVLSHNGWDTRAVNMQASGYKKVAENVATCHGIAGEHVSQVLVDGWIKSPSHHRNIIESRFSYSGMGVAIGEDNRIYLTQLFAE